MPNTSKNPLTKKKKQSARRLDVFNDPPIPVYLKIIIVTAVILFLAWLLLFNGGHRYSTNIGEVRNRIQTTLEAIQLPGNQLVSGMIDQGCDSGTSVGLSTRIECSMEGYKYFEITGNKKTALRLADAKIESLGFTKYTNNEYTTQVLDSIREGDIDYSKQYTNVRVGWSILPSASVNGPDSTAISDALSSRRIGTFNDGATIVGVVVREAYWTCSTGGLDLLGLICIFPPHSPNK